MAKILLVEDNNNLREIYEARLVAEGYDIVTARDGEEALSVAMKEKPDLIISDVMMPKISGFDMLDILRNTEETKHVKIIMMTALSQAEDKERAEKLGADRYLVKSQVTLEDVAKVAKEVLEGETTATQAPAVASPAPAAESPQPAPAAVAAPTPVATPAPVAAPVPEPVATPTPVATPAPTAIPVVDQIASEEQAIAEQIEATLTQPLPPQPAPVAAPVPEPVATPTPVATPAPVAAPVVPEPVAVPAPVAAPVPEPVATPTPVATPAPTAIPVVDQSDTTTATDLPTVEPQTVASDLSNKKKVIEPINDLSQDSRPKLDELLAKEQEKEQMSSIAAAIAQQPAPAPAAQPTSIPVTDATPVPPAAPTPDTKIDPNSIAL